MEKPRSEILEMMYKGDRLMCPWCNPVFAEYDHSKVETVSIPKSKDKDGKTKRGKSEYKIFHPCIKTDSAIKHILS
jgi:hypothetical protein